MDKPRLTLTRYLEWTIIAEYSGHREAELSTADIEALRKDPDLIYDTNWLDELFSDSEIEDETLVKDTWCHGGVDFREVDCVGNFCIESLAEGKNLKDCMF